LVLSVVFVLSICSSSHAVPFATAEYGTVPHQEYNPYPFEQVLNYYNFCSEWVLYWTGYCNELFVDNLPVQYGVCFDMDDYSWECGHLTDTWWAMKRHSARYAVMDIEVYCADEGCGPVGQPLAGVYGYVPDASTPWQHISWGLVPVCVCWGGDNFCVLITDYTAGIHSSPYTDHASLNVGTGCQDWRCSGHSYVYRNAISYCDWYGTPGPMWMSGANFGCTNYPPIPAGCHNYNYPTGVFLELLMDCYVVCFGGSATEKQSWSEIKALYR
jgi:hypothetical protein